jgi:hypothetical protein
MGNEVNKFVTFFAPHQGLFDDALVGGEIFPTHFFWTKHPIFVQNLA